MTENEQDKAASEPPDGVGENMGRRGEEATKREGKEAGRFDTGSDGTAGDRPTGESTSRDVTGVDPQQTVTADQKR